MMRIGNILCPIDFSSLTGVAMPIACAFARDYGATLILLHVRPSVEPFVGEFGALPLATLEPDDACKKRLRECVPASFEGAVDCEVNDGGAVEQIVKTALLRHCDLIVLGTHGRSGLNRLVLGSVAEAVLRRAPCPVLTVKPAITKPIAVDEAEVEPNLNSAD